MVSRADSDPGLVFDLTADGRTDRLESLYRSYSLTIRRHVERTFGMGPPDPEDAVQAAFERFARVPDQNEIKDPLSFLRRSARNFVLDHHRAAKVRSVHARSANISGDECDDFDAERVLSAKERLAIIDHAIRAMDERRREVLIMNRVHGLSCAEIAIRLACSPTLVKLRLGEAVTLCRRALRAADGDV